MQNSGCWIWGAEGRCKDASQGKSIYYKGYFGVYIGILENKLGTTILGLGVRVQSSSLACGSFSSRPSLLLSNLGDLRVFFSP